MSEAFLEQRPERVEAYGKLLNVMRLDTYRWNYNRISEDCRVAFCERWASEYEKQQKKGLMDPDYFSPSDWILVNDLMDDPSGFAVKHPDL